MAGEHDPAMAAIRSTHEKIPGSILEVIPGAGHLSNLDNPEAFMTALLAFLEGVETGG